MAIDLAQFHVVLVEPTNPENIGTSARAMKNCGLSRLALVRPVDPIGPSALRPAMEARDLVERAEVFESLEGAVRSSRMVVGTTRRMGQDRSPLLSPQTWIREVLPRAEGQEVAILFGSEKDGLQREAVDRCDVLVTIPAHPGFASFNLAQAVLLVGYELFRASADFPSGGAALELSTLQAREELFRHLEAVLLRVGFLHDNNPGRIMASLRRLFGRSGLEEREVRILRGILSQVEWALKQERR